MRLGFARLPICAAAIAAALVCQAIGQERVQVPPQILTLDQERLFTNSRAAERVSAEIEERSKALAAENRAIETELVAEELDLTKRRPNLPPAEFRALADAFDAKVQGIRSEQDAKTRELQRLRELERQNFFRRISPLLADIVRERGALVVIDRRSVILSAESIDITDEAIGLINATVDDTPADTTPAIPEPAQPTAETPAPVGPSNP